MGLRYFVFFCAAAMAACSAQSAEKTTPQESAHHWDAASAAAVDDLVAANRILSALNIIDSAGHISVRSPTNSDHFFLSRSRAAGLINHDDILEFNLDGEPVHPTQERLFLERFIHAATYKARPDVGAVLHSHSEPMLPFTITTVPLRAVTHDAAFLKDGPRIFEADPDGSNGTLLVTNMDRAGDLAQMLGDDSVVLIRGHGDVVVDLDLPRVVNAALNIDKNARVLLAAIQLGGPISYITPAEVKARAELRANVKVVRDWPHLKALYDHPLTEETDEGAR